MDRIRLIFLSVLLLCSATLSAAGTELYRAQLLVGAQSGQPGSAEVRSGLEAVLVKVAGDRDVLRNVAVRNGLENPYAYLRQFGYSQSNQVIGAEEGTARRAYQLVLDYDQRAIDRLLASADRKPLGNRPTLMVWLAAQQFGPRDYVAPGGQIYQLFEAAAEQRGLPLQQPLLDLTDQQMLPAADIWGLFADSIEQASRRYRADAVLAGRMVQRGADSWSIDWLLISGSQQQRFTGSGGLTEEVQAMIELAADTLFASLGGGGVAEQPGELSVTIDNVVTLSDYMAIVDYLATVPAVGAVNPAEVAASRLRLRVRLEGHVEQFEQALRLEPRLVPVDNLDGSYGLAYRWQR